MAWRPGRHLAARWVWWLVDAERHPIGPCAPLLRSGGEGGIRTLDGFPHTPLAGERLQPLGHLSERRKIPRFSTPREPADAVRPTAKQQTPQAPGGEMAEREGFEPSRGLHPWRFSRPLPSTARPPLRVGILGTYRVTCLPMLGTRVRTVPRRSNDPNPAKPQASLAEVAHAPGTTCARVPHGPNLPAGV